MDDKGGDMRSLGWVLVVLAVLFSVLAHGQAVITGDFHEHALAVVGGENFAVARGRTVEIWSTGNLAAPVRTLRGAEGNVCSLALSRDGAFLAAGDQEGYITIWRLPGTMITHKKAHRFAIWTLSFSPDGRLLATGSFDGTVRLWDVTTWTEVGVFVDPALKEGTHTGWVRCVTFSPEGKFLATSGCDGYVRLWDLATLRLVHKIKGGNNVYSVNFLPDGEFLVWSNNPGDIKIYRAGSWEEVKTLAPARKTPVYVIAFSPDGTLLAAGGNSKLVQVWDLARGALVREFPGHTDQIWMVVFFPDGKHLISTAEDGTARIWDLEG
jgi:WD40 repeat protein